MFRAFLAVCWVLLVSLPAWALNAGLGAPPPTVDRQTPQSTVKGFLAEAHAGNYAVAAHYLDLDFLPRDKQPETGAQLARRLKFVLDRKLPVDLSTLSSEPEGDPAEARFDQIGTISLEGAEVSIRVQRVLGNGGTPVWVFSESTVKEVDRLFSAYGPVLTEVLPDFFFKRTVLGLEAWQWLGLLLVLGGGWALSLLLERLSLAFTMRLARWTKFSWDDALVDAGRGPLRLPYYAVLVALGTSVLLLPRPVQTLFARLSYSLTIVAVAWFILRFLKVSSLYVQQRVASKNPNDADRIRGLSTQLAVLRHVLEVATYVIAAALLLMQFEVVRNVGVSLLASAGLAGLVIGLAAQKSISTLLAGIQLSVTQPIRMGDKVVVEGEFGTVEEISLTYVVVRIWDNRRLVIPIAQFLDKPFQNWSRSHSEMLGEVILQVDYFADIDVLRAELKRILENEGRQLWDGKVQSVVVLNVLDKTLSVRALVSADSNNLFDLRCLVRERLVVFLRGRPGWLPTVRSETRPVTPAGEPSPSALAPAPRA
ncbi:mechanosensitive ion channel family protein [Stigmatella sp. ncwal1]|uniref:Mechanosensitive ion channel family protein n=1 Tax=Stigmatella ashevillensis TaxID=2995309 RepID=A0ABT5D9D7_9BACT|nr:mechanosensitive ion channel family protein [Stigmatella ashevillena]MDC0709685.1 mechanosensitive ion channel family protein [Stigmatella ashevillena]